MEKNIKITADDILSYKFCSKKWEYDRIIKTLNLYKNGKTFDEIAEITFFTSNRVKEILKEYKFI